MRQNVSCFKKYDVFLKGDQTAISVSNMKRQFDKYNFNVIHFRNRPQ